MRNLIPAFLALTIAVSGSMSANPVMAHGKDCPKKEGCKDKAAGKECKHKKHCNKAEADDCCKDKEGAAKDAVTEDKPATDKSSSDDVKKD